MTNLLFDTLIGPLANDAAPLIFSDTATVSRATFFTQVTQSANALIHAGVKPGDRVCVQADKSIELLSVYAAAFGLGAVFVPLNTAYTPRELASFLSDCEPRLFLTDGWRRDALAPIVPDSVTLHTLGVDGSFWANADTQIRFVVAEASTDTPAALLYTSGTTGRAKGAVLTHGNLLSNAQALVDCWQFTTDDVLLHALPIFHAHGLFVATNVTLLAGGCLRWLPDFTVDAVIDALPFVTAMMGVPTYYTRLVNDHRLTHQLTENVRVFISGSAPLTAETFTSFETKTGRRLVERYGMTETGMNTSNLLDDARRGTVGRALPGVEVRVVDATTGAALGAHVKGMVQVRGANVFGGYWQRDDANAQAFTSDGFFITGDLGMIDGDGFLTLVGRETDLIISGGLNVYPTEVEQLIALVPGVTDCAVVGVIHPDFGEAVIAVVVVDDTYSEDELLATTRNGLANFKRPKRVFVVDELPRNALGKVQKALLRQTYANTF